MAAGGANGGFNFDDETLERLKKVRRLRELFHGRFTDNQCGTFLRHVDWDLGAAATFILDADPAQLQDVLAEDAWQVVGVRRDIVIRDLARRNVVGAEIRQYGCKDCDNMWWRRVPTRKPVSRCKMCGRKWDPIPTDEEWGWAKFRCECQNEFHAFGMMDLKILNIGLSGKSKCLCWKCRRHLCEPEYILKPLRRDSLGRRNRYAHECTADNCYNQCPRRLHPKSSKIKEMTEIKRENELQVPGDGSESHVSTGSTVKTFLTQDDLAPPYSPYEPSMADIDEVRSENSDGGDNNGGGDNI